MPSANFIKHLYEGLDVISWSQIEDNFVHLLRVEPLSRQSPFIPWTLSALVSDGKYAVFALLAPELSEKAQAFELPALVKIRVLSMVPFSGSRYVPVL